MASQLPTDHPHNEETWGGGVAPSISGPVEKVDVVHMDKTHQHVEEETTGDSSLDLNLVYADDDHEPEIHFRTIIAVFAMFVLLFTQNVALQGPPFILSFIAEDLKKGAADQIWVPNCLSLVQAAVAPLICAASDTFQVRKEIIIASSLISLIGAAIAPGSQDFGRLIAAQTLIGIGFAAVPLDFTVPSEILPRKWRPMVQGLISLGSSFAPIAAPMYAGALVRANPSGWRTFYWIQVGMWGFCALVVFFSYRPPKRHTRLDHLSFFQKMRYIDLIGCALILAGLTLLLTSLNLGGNEYSWSNFRVLLTMLLGIGGLVAFGLYEWKGTDHGLLNHELFEPGRARMFTICILLIFIEGVIVFAFIIFYPALGVRLFTHDPVILGARSQPFWVGLALGTLAAGYVSTKIRSIRESLFAGFFLNMVGLIGFATIQPGQSLNPLFFAALTGFGTGSPLILCITGVQLVTPHKLLATATAVTIVSRSIGATVSTAVYWAAAGGRLARYIPSYVAAAAATNGLPTDSTLAFVGAVASGNATALALVPGVNDKIVAAGMGALQQAYADGYRVVYIIAAPFAALGCVLCCFLPSVKNIMNYHVDAPIEPLHAKQKTKGAAGSRELQELK